MAPAAATRFDGGWSAAPRSNSNVALSLPSGITRSVCGNLAVDRPRIGMTSTQPRKTGGFAPRAHAWMSPCSSSDRSLRRARAGLHNSANLVHFFAWPLITTWSAPSAFHGHQREAMPVGSRRGSPNRIAQPPGPARRSERRAVVSRVILLAELCFRVTTTPSAASRGSVAPAHWVPASGQAIGNPPARAERSHHAESVRACFVGGHFARRFLKT